MGSVEDAIWRHQHHLAYYHFPAQSLPALWFPMARTYNNLWEGYPQASRSLCLLTCPKCLRVHFPAGQPLTIAWGVEGGDTSTPASVLLIWETLSVTATVPSFLQDWVSFHGPCLIPTFGWDQIFLGSFPCRSCLHKSSPQGTVS
jgi:hypothetical protein